MPAEARSRNERYDMMEKRKCGKRGRKVEGPPRE
jgi:hypothetical protein